MWKICAAALLATSMLAAATSARAMGGMGGGGGGFGPGWGIDYGKSSGSDSGIFGQTKPVKHMHKKVQQGVQQH
jgi:hypothetical protein